MIQALGPLGVGGVALAGLVLLLVVRVPVAIALAAVGGVGLWAIRNETVATKTLSATAFTATSSIDLVAVPLFIAMGMLAVKAGIATGLYAAAARWLSRLPAGLGLATIVACGFFAAVTGSSVATAASIGRFAIAEMRRYGYANDFCAGIVGTAGTLGILIPPSIVLVLYGIVAGESIGALLIAGIVPGLLSLVMMMTAAMLRVVIDPAVAPRRAAADVESGTLATAVSGVGKTGVLFLVAVGSIYAGIATPSEAAALGAVVAFVFALAEARKAWGPGLAGIVEAFKETASLTSMTFFIVVGASIFTAFLSLAGVPRVLSEFVLALDAPAWLVMVAILAIYLPLGMFLDGISILLITTPLVYPLVTNLGYDGVWFGVMLVKMIEIGLITPPVGINAFVISGRATGVRVEEAFRGLAWFIPFELATVAILFAFPDLVTFLPRSMGQ
ncbi:TRAP transporter large permease [Acuticoccus sp. I52.16.1]|uniref:TRAP transporter large permease n=1 Tax=Acuticoccus sp. I52.16.1 TaxID=2928472 RepID=UPI001FD13CA5|nr:TRAP transporter large permease [Acuticoccus sp. I52.16.1]UOM36578.1 TRAP transporter large permease [Acuticoccus sp. I52.16.1]